MAPPTAHRTTTTAHWTASDRQATTQTATVSARATLATPLTAPSLSALRTTRLSNHPTATLRLSLISRGSRVVLCCASCDTVCAGVVSGVVGPRGTSGTDLLLSVTLSDPTCVDGVCFNLFRSSAASFPQLRVGDVMRVHRCAIQVYAGNKVGGTVKEKSSQFVCYRADRDQLHGPNAATHTTHNTHGMRK